MTAHLLIEDFSLVFRTRHGTVRALEDVSLSVERGEIVGVVGESGSGKSVLAYAVMGLQDAAARVQGGRIMFGGLDMLAASESALADVRGRELAMIFQSPRTALNPIRKVGRQIEDILREHANLPRRELRHHAIAALARVRIPDPERRYEAYPFELSGGMCQRVMIAMALACSPFLLIADEPTTGLDVTTQAVIMDLIRDMSRDAHMSTLLITHDLGLAGEYCDRIAVMHAGPSCRGRADRGIAEPAGTSVYAPASGLDADAALDHRGAGLDPGAVARSAPRPAALPLQRPLRSPCARMRREAPALDVAERNPPSALPEFRCGKRRCERRHSPCTILGEACSWRRPSGRRSTSCGIGADG